VAKRAGDPYCSRVCCEVEHGQISKREAQEIVARRATYMGKE
jgi:hypothetical protein